MTRRPSGLGGTNPLQEPEVLPRLVPTTVDAPTEPKAGKASKAGDASKAGKAGTQRREANDLPTDRRPGSVARTGPMSLRAGATKKSVSTYIDPDLLEEARDTVVALGANPDGPRSFAALVEEGLRREIVRLQDELNDHQPFPHRRVALRPGGNTRDV